MIEQRNLITLPRTCYGGGFIAHDKSVDSNVITYNNLQIVSDIEKQITKNSEIESIVNNKNINIYIHLDIRKNIKLDSNLLSGEVQALQCSHYILSYQDLDYNTVITVKSFLDQQYFNPEYSIAKNLIINAMDFDLINEQDYILIPKHFGSQWSKFSDYWHDKLRSDKLHLKSKITPKDKIVLHLSEVLPYTNNTTITSEDVVKLGRMLSTTENCKVALTLMNTVNPYKSLPELLCLCNYIPAAIRKETKIAVLPLLYGAYEVLDINRNVDGMVKTYEEVMGKASIEVLEKFADSYYNSRIEKSSIYDFKLKIKKNG